MCECLIGSLALVVHRGACCIFMAVDGSEVVLVSVLVLVPALPLALALTLVPTPLRKFGNGTSTVHGASRNLVPKLEGPMNASRVLIGF